MPELMLDFVWRPHYRGLERPFNIIAVIKLDRFVAPSWFDLCEQLCVGLLSSP